ncbi:MAG: TolC family protein [Oleispira sp.]|nr:TolC family protein [Oleispira sp.]MBL4880512.1 TolC family protein [Oleispira sp.]
MRFFLLISAGLFLSGCTTIDTLEPEIPQLAEHFIEPVTQPLPREDTWWLSFDDEKLNTLIQLALSNNYSLKASYARLQQSQAQWEKAGSSQLPDLNLELQRSQKWQDSGSAGQYKAGLSASYELDFWGRVAALDEKALQEYYATESAVSIQTNTVVSNVALSWFGWVKETQQLQLLHHQQQRIQNALTVVQGRYLRGTVIASDIWQQEQLLESLNSDIIIAETRQDVYRQQLGLWLGKNTLDEALLALPNTYYQIPDILQATEQVSSLALQQRPDVLQAYAQLQAASAGLQVAETNRYPRFTLSVSYSSLADTPEKILSNWAANFIAGLTMPLFDGGNLAAEVKRNEAVVSEQLANYQQVLLIAMQEIEEALLNERQQLLLQTSVQYQLQLANQTQNFQSQRYLRGIGDFLSLLKSQQDVLTLERQTLGAEFLQLQYRIQLLTTLSHGRFTNADEKESEHE